MALPYRYIPLDDPAKDIRVVTILPAAFEGDIRLLISHVTLSPYPTGQESFGQNQQRLSVEELKKTVPDGWWVYETTEHNILFYYEDADGKNWKSSWDHPNPGFDRALYCAAPDDEQDTGEGGGPLLFEALSYTWGSAKVPETALLKDCDVKDLGNYSDESNKHGFQTLEIGGNLASALRHLRSTDRSRLIWIDAVCIDQSNDAEREVQVTRMADIYQRCSQVIVWVGDEADNSPLAMKTLKYLGEQVLTTTDLWMFNRPGAEEPYWCESNCALPYNKAQWFAINALLHRPWFERVWIIQEIQLGRHKATLQCGHENFSWNLFQAAMVCLWNKQDIPSSLNRSRLAFVEELVSTDLTSVPIPYIFRLTRGRKCLLGHDYLYGVLGLLPPNFKLLIKPDYAQPAANAYKAVTVSHAHHVGRLELLRESQSAGRHVVGIPSWVPDFSSRSNNARPVEWQFAAGYSRAKFEVLEKEDALAALGVQCAVVDLAVSTPLTGPSQSGNEPSQASLPGQEYKSDFGDLFRAFFDIGGAYLTGESSVKAYARTIASDYLRDRYPEERLPTSDEWVLDVMNPSFTERIVEGSRATKSLSFIEDQTAGFLLRRVFLRTGEGYIGFGPSNAKPGDVVVVFLGCDSPILLRPQPEGNYTVLGECFFYGLSDASALLGPMPPGYCVQVFKNSASRLGTFRFLNTETGQLTDDDPRLPSLPDEWEGMPRDRTGDDPASFQLRRNSATGDVVTFDVRLEPEELTARGVALERFVLV